MNVQRQQLLAQVNENELVLSELKLLESDAAVYKQIGPALVKQDLADATITVSGRKDLITKQM